MNAGNELAVRTENVKNRIADAGHDMHVDHNVSGVRDLNADLGDIGTDRSHGERDDIHGSAMHAAFVESRHLGFEFLGINPVICGACIFFLLGSNESTGFDTRHVGRIASEENAVGTQFAVQAGRKTGFDHFIAEPVILCVRTVTPVDGVRLAELGPLVDPCHHLRMVRGRIQILNHFYLH